MNKIQFKKIAPLVLVVIMFVSACVGGIATVPKVAAQTETMQFRYNAAHIGDYSSVAGSVQPNNVLKWSFTTGGVVESSPAVVNGIVYVGSWDHNVYAVNAQTGAELWRYPTGSPVFSSPAVVNGIAYVGSNGGDLYALNAQTGARLWHFTPSSGGVYSSPTVVNNVVYIGSDDHNLYALDANDGHKVWSYTAGDRITSSPAVSNGLVYFGCHDNKVYALDANDGHKVWDYSVGYYIESSPTVSNGKVYIGSGYGGKLYALDANDGHKVWDRYIGYSVSSPAIANGIVYEGGGDNLYALDANDGHVLWTYTTHIDAYHSGPFYSSPAVANGIVYAGSDGTDRNVYAFDAQTGSKLWSFSLSAGADYSSPAVVDGLVYIGDAGESNGKLYAIGNPPSPNQPPTANAGPAQSVHVGTLVTLDGTNSKDTDGTVASYAWTLVSSPAGSNPTLSDPTTAKPTFTPDKLGPYVFSLKVTDDNGAESTNDAQVTITATNDPPTANAGPDQTVRVKTAVTLDGRQSTDTNGDPITYTWSIVTKPKKSTAQLTGGTTAQPTFTPDKTGSYTIKLVVTDKYGLQSSDTVIVSVNNSKPPKPHK